MNRSHAGLATIALTAFSLISLLFAGCGEEYEPYLRGEGEFTLSGDVDEQLRCKMRWRKVEHSGVGRRGNREFTSPTLVCGEQGEERFLIQVMLWHDADGAAPDLKEGTYPTVLRSIDCPVSGPPCSSGQIHRENGGTLLTLADEGELVFDRVEQSYISGSIDAVFTDPRDESSDTIRIVGEFTVASR